MTGSMAAARETLARLSLEERVGLLMHSMVLIDPAVDLDAPSPIGGASIRELVVDRGIRYFGLGGGGSLTEIADFTARLQELALSSGSRLPIVFSSDPRHGFQENAAASRRADGVSQWPDPAGFGALGDVELVRAHASIVRQDYVAMGIRMALHPQVDLATEPRWARQVHSFSADSGISSQLVAAYIEGLQGTTLGASGVAATTKHFPGGGAQLDGEDPHFPYGREQVYPGGRFADHLEPFRAAIAAGTAAIMPYYGMPVGLTLNGEPVEEVGFSFNRRIITGLLREELGFEGVILSDFGLVTDVELFGKPFPARAWGVEHLSREERVLRLLDAGIDQLGGESDTALVLRLVAEGRLDEGRIDASALRVLALHEALEPGATPAAPVVAREHVELGARTQSRAMVVLSDGEDSGPLLPLSGPLRVHSRGLGTEAFPPDWSPADPLDADIAVVRLASPFEPRDHYFLESGMQQGSLDFDDDTIAAIEQLASSCPVVLVVTLNRPAILTPFVGVATAILADFGASDAAVVAALTGIVPPAGSLPFELPRSMAAVEASSPDVASDTLNPLFSFAHQLRLAHRSTAPQETP